MRHLILENFMPFSGRRTIPIAPLTLIFGPNNAGKSAIIRALLMLKQTATDGDENSPLFSAGQPEDPVDLGKFTDYVFRHDTSLPVTVGLTTRVHRSPESVERMQVSSTERDPTSLMNLVSISRTLAWPQWLAMAMMEKRSLTGSSSSSTIPGTLHSLFLQ